MSTPSTLSQGDILLYPHKGLRKKAQEINRITDSHRALIDKMIAIMHEAEGIGLAAPQINLSLRLIVIDIPEDRDKNAGQYVMINPVILQKSAELGVAEEGCLSLPGLIVPVERPVSISMTFRDQHNKMNQLDDIEGLLARCIQHEIDHLDGKLIIDHVSSLRRMRMLKAWKKAQQED